MTAVYWVLGVWFGLNLLMILATAAFVISRTREVWVAIEWVVLAAVGVVVQTAAIPLVPIAALFLRRRGERAAWVDKGGAVVEAIVPAYRLPWLFKWLETHDDGAGSLPGGTYEEPVRKLYQRFGVYVAAVYWLLRNRAYRATAAISDVSYLTHDACDPHFWSIGDERCSIMLMETLDYMGEGRNVDAFQLRARWRWPNGKFFTYSAGWKIADFADVDGAVGAASGMLQVPSPRPMQSE